MSEKKSVKLEWFSKLRTGYLDIPFTWLSPFKDEVEKIANFGCRSSEPFALLWALDATEIVVIEKEKDNLIGPNEDKELLQKLTPDSLAGRSVEFIVADMTTEIQGLQSDYFDLAFCKSVLYHIEGDNGQQGLQYAIKQMIRCVKPGGIVIAVESSIDNLHAFFKDEGLNKETKCLPPNKETKYHCYRKPQV